MLNGAPSGWLGAAMRANVSFHYKPPPVTALSALGTPTFHGSRPLYILVCPVLRAPHP
jgi:hypothetical protein